MADGKRKADTLKMSTDTDMHDWFLERDVKDPAVILNDKLISDALLNGTLPIKSEHSYSLNSDGDSMPDSPRSLHKIDDMEDECYPAISLKTATSNLRHMDSAANATIDPKCLTISSRNSGMGNGSGSTSMHTSQIVLPMHGSGSCSSSSVFDSGLGLGKMSGGATLSFNLRTLESGSGGYTNIASKGRQKRHDPSHYLPQQLTSIGANICGSPASSCDGSSSPDICSDIEIDESCIKDEPVSPNSSYPPSPSGAQMSSANGSTLSLNMAKMAAFTNSDLVFEHKNGCLQLTPASHSLLKSQQLLMGPTNIIIPKFSIKSEMAAGTNGGLKVNTTTPGKGGAYGLPLTPPSSLQSDDSEGNLSPEHLLSPLSPNSTVSITVSSATGGGGSGGSGVASGSGLPMSASTGNTAAAVRRGTGSSSSSSSSVSCHSSARNISGSSTRQPIHTPLISSQPKGSTGNLILTEEEKRTLLAEGYPIPQKLPLTKAEEKSLKKIRRKIKNKISAQESRRKKKEYMDQLERRVEILVNENCEYRKRVDTLEDTNSNLLSQLHKLQALVQKQGSKKS